MSARRSSQASAGFKSDLSTVRESFDKTPRHILVEVRNKRTRTSIESLNMDLDEKVLVKAAQKRILNKKPNETSFKRAMRWLGEVCGLPTARKDMTILTNYLALGNDETAGNYVELYDTGITHICTVASQCDLHFLGKFIYLHIKIKDNPTLDITLHFDVVFEFINRVKDLQGRVFVHCVSGVSRSVTCVIAYLMKYESLTLNQAYNFIKQRRPLICPNQGFRYQLALYEILLYGTSSVSQTNEKDWDFYEWNVYKQRITTRK
ncbi:dual specificity protein phosphatase [Thraustotheca clavata]|uniref:protein-tyrosine-phosphatase n=1 Tax=Thraustotheca clavata TaxID=74557 RepID=A0A1W0A8H6_9STRA|nr:dual specificity protein phosphatase [Thraustotheca clavata]